MELRDANPVPRDRIEGWSRSPEGIATRDRVQLDRPAGSHRRPAWVTAAVAAALILALVAAVLVLQRGGGRTRALSGTAIDRLAAGKWQRLDAGPTKRLGIESSVWTGKELIVWGDRTNGSEGAAFDPDTGKWRLLPDWPLGLRSGAIVRWTGSEMLVWGGLDPRLGSVVAPRDGAAYNPATNTWRAISPAPLPPSAGSAATWTGHDLVVTSGKGDVSAAAAYDPLADEWRLLPNPPVSLLDALAVSGAWDGRDVVYTVDTGFPVRRVAMAYDPRAVAWRTLPAPPYGQGIAGLVPSGKGVVQMAWHWEPDVIGSLQDAHLARGAKLWAPGTGVFAHRGKCSNSMTSLAGGAAIWCGGDDLVALDFGSGKWRQLPHVGGKNVVLGPMVWTGRELLSVAGTATIEHPLADNELLSLHPASR
jgi:hypothetical protein